MFDQLRKELERYNRIIIHRHGNPDGDALGAQIGLKHLLRENYPRKEIYAVGDPARRYAFMEDSVMDDVADGLYPDALAIVLDTSAVSLISDSRYATAAQTVRIDHHIFVEQIAQVEWTDTSYESCCGMIAALAEALQWRVTPIAAKSLFTGMVTDSGRFRYDSVNSETFRLASFLMRVPFSTNDIYANLYADDFEYIRLRAQFVLKIRFTERHVAYIYTDREEAKGFAADTFTISRGMVGTMSDIRGVSIWVNFTETDAGVLCEIRSNRYNINPIAVKYGGGGHEKASGATVADRLEAMQLLEDLDRMMEVDA
ncbi:MAG: bifunctional oligoribonuclease/PAP phosphatase NrnA [Clostridia bacterium]|nr:bifunctional oligoribonuclease/PAP phosphatase NrnA [Clostridia bacterium]